MYRIKLFTSENSSFQFGTNIKILLRPLVARLINYFLINDGDFSYYEYFEYWQKRGFNLIPNHFYQPIPDISKIPLNQFKKISEMKGVDMKDKNQIALLNHLDKYKNEYSKFENINIKVKDQVDPKYYFGNIAHDGVDAIVYYHLIRSLRPKNIIEVGSGWSTKLAAQACLINQDTTLVSIDPYPQPIIKKGIPGLSKLIMKNIEDIPLSYFKTLKKGDFLFIDSSHTVKIAGDVNYLFLEVLPRLNKGVYVHIHDIFLPYDYLKKWVINEHRFWTEQYLLHAFLLFNDTFEVVYSNSYMYAKHSSEVRSFFSKEKAFERGSFWIKKVK